MGSVIFRVLLVLLILGLVYSTIVHERGKKKRLRKKIADGFGSKDPGPSSSGWPGVRPALFDQLISQNPDTFVIDDITANDLGLGDVYCRMNRCVTPAGKDFLYCLFLMTPKWSGEILYDRISAFIGDREKALQLLYILAGYSRSVERDDLKLIQQLKDAAAGSIISDIAMLAAIAAAAVLSCFYPMPGVIAVAVLIIVNIALYFSGKGKMEQSLQGIAVSLRIIECAKKLSEKGYSDLDTYSSLYHIRRGNFLISYKDQTTSDPLSIIFDYVRMMTHVDLMAYKLKISAVKKHSEELESLYADIGRLDAALSVASYLIPRKHCRADVTEKYSINARSLYHPLVENSICNDITLCRGALVTGSNASGKSTFLRAVGISSLFAQNFGFAFADEFETGPFAIYTSMALTDNILQGESYYVVEARSIKRICDAADGGGCLCIIDEVLRGTNTIERIAASSRILRYLCKDTVICLAATHDLELTRLLGREMDLYHFTEEISDDNVVFPYVIKEGVSDRTNAVRLLGMLGFDRKIVSSALDLVDTYKKTGHWLTE